MKYFSMFSGVGGFEKGIENAIAEIKSKDSSDSKGGTSQHVRRAFCVGYSEIDKHAIQIYEKHFKGHKNYGDCTKIKWSEIPDFDLLVGGTPCQDLSIAGKRKGLAGNRSGLFRYYILAIKEKKPRFFVWENVKGALSSNEGRDFAEVINSFSEAGYDLQWDVLNSKNFGVPQNRERVFIIGHSRGTCRPEVFPIGTQPQDNTQQTDKLPVQTSNTLRSNYSNGFANECYTTQGVRIRRLTPTECMFLQGFPRDWTRWGVDKATPVMYSSGYVDATKTNAIKILQTLQKAIKEDSRERWGFTKFASFLEEEILQSGMYEAILSGCLEEKCPTTTRQLSSKAIDCCNRMFYLWSKEMSRYTSQEQEQIGQLIGKLASTVSKLPHEITPQRRWMESSKKEKKQQGTVYFPLISDSQQYRCLGNAVTVNVVQAIMERLIYEH